MIDGGLIFAGVALYLFGNYTIAFWLIVLSIISGAGAAIKAVANPGWYLENRARAGLEVNIVDPSSDIRSLVITKVVIILPMIFLAYFLGGKAGYF
jgi:hypothetical protein